jgi:hypothetical protein
MLRWVAAGLLLIASLQGAAAAVRPLVVTRDGGGLLDEYELRWRRAAAARKPIVIDGPCASACTMFLGIVPLRRVCVTRRAELGFHSGATLNRDGSSSFSAYHTRRLWEPLPDAVKDAVRRGGWDGQSEHPDLVVLRGRELQALLRPCRSAKG